MDFSRTNSPAAILPMLGRRDLLCVGLLIAMAAALVPGLDPVNQDRYLCDVIGQMASYWVLPSMGFLLALRCGVLDLSVWMAFSAGSVAAAWLLARGCPAGAALAAGIGVGAAMGAANALLVRRSRLPSGLVTLVTALGVFLLLRWLLPERTLVRPGDAWKAWHWLGLGGMDNDVSHPLFMTRMLLVIMFYGATMLTMLAASSRYVAPGPLLLSEEERGHWMERTFSAGTQRTLALIVGGALSAAGGVLLLMDNDRATVPTWPIGDLRIPAAALLAGGLLLKGPRRTLLAGMCLPPAFTLATAWRQTGWGLEYQGYSLQLLLLVAGAGLMVLAARAAERSPRRGGHWAAAWLAAGAVTVWCASTNFTSPAVLEALRWTGAGLMAASATIHTAAKFCPASVGGNP